MNISESFNEDMDTLVTVDENIGFHKVNRFSSLFQIVKKSFIQQIEPVYGCQKNAIAKLESGEDRCCEVLFSGANMLGLIVYKNCLQNEYDLEGALELKTLFLFNPEKNSGRGLGTKLFQRIYDIAFEMGAKSIYCTASSKKSESIECALKNGYRISRLLKEEGKEKLYLLIKKVNIDENG